MSMLTQSGPHACEPGETVIHVAHGRARYDGQRDIAIGDGTQPFLELTYRNGGKLHLPTSERKHLWRLAADPAHITLDKLNAGDWRSRRDEIVAELKDAARDIVALRNERLEKRFDAFTYDADAYTRFAESFPHDETEDQNSAVDDILGDLRGDVPMDRLVIGDVGFGKTEVALRAIVATVLAGFQVAVATPTTVLCRQHLKTFKERLEPFDIRVGELSRFSSAAEVKALRTALADGSLDVVVGTHRLTSKAGGKTLDFAKLGLVIIDEEQKFGFKRKQKMRKLGRNVNLLTMTATPIPKSLSAAELGLCDVSILATPPAARLPVDTSTVSAKTSSWATIINREAKRDGQTYVVCPKIKGLSAVKRSIRDAFPDLRVEKVHGKLSKAKIEKRMLAFADGEIDVLVCTAVVESGLDIANANTMIVFDPQDFGLSQLHQLRGRIGRSGRQAHMALMVDDATETESDGARRLAVFCNADQLGAGFELAQRDFGMRGGGDMLGEEQSGHISQLGVGLYQHLLKQELERCTA